MGIFHQYIQNKFLLESIDWKNRNVLSNDKVRLILSNNKIPKDIQVTFLSEMEELKLIKRKDKRNIIIKSIDDIV